jgi:hypothetical protein
MLIPTIKPENNMNQGRRASDNDQSDSTFFVKACKYLSERIIPLLLIPILAWIVYGYGAIVDLENVKKETERISKEHSGRIMKNGIDIRETNRKVSELTQLIQDMSDMKTDMRTIKETVDSMNISVGILKDRYDRENK